MQLLVNKTSQLISKIHRSARDVHETVGFPILGFNVAPMALKVLGRDSHWSVEGRIGVYPVSSSSSASSTARFPMSVRVHGLGGSRRYHLNVG